MSKDSNHATLKVDRIPIEKLVPHPRNPRMHPEPGSPQWEAMRKSLDSDYFDPVVWNSTNGFLVSGHLRVKVLTDMGATHADAVVKDYDESTHLARMICANQQQGEDIGAAIIELTDELRADGIDMAMVGMTDEQIQEIADSMIDDTDAVVEDDAPEPPDDPLTEPGRMYQLGKHRLMCGDSTDATTVGRLLGDDKPCLMVTDPPYGVEYDPSWRNDALRDDGTAIGARAVGKVMNDDRADWREAWALFTGDVAYVWHAGLFANTVADSLIASGFDLKSQIIWAKSNFAIGRSHYHWKHEPCWYAVRTGKTAGYEGDRKQTTLWEIAKPAKSETGHGTQKPVECMSRPILNNSKRGDTVYEPFCGSGTTLVACEQTGRLCRAMELDPKYCDVIVRRWANLVGADASEIFETGVSNAGW